ncbi:MAG: hypothetical protein FJ267_16990 [Planctomycetes bacterium]|nr:hypothetical protein [Planctomycetota bacterium]
MTKTSLSDYSALSRDPMFGAGLPTPPKRPTEGLLFCFQRGVDKNDKYSALFELKQQSRARQEAEFITK